MKRFILGTLVAVTLAAAFPQAQQGGGLSAV